MTAFSRSSRRSLDTRRWCPWRISREREYGEQAELCHVDPELLHLIERERFRRDGAPAMMVSAAVGDLSMLSSGAVFQGMNPGADDQLMYSTAASVTAPGPAGRRSRSRIIDLAGLRATADDVGALPLTDVPHVAGLAAAGLRPSPGRSRPHHRCQRCRSATRDPAARRNVGKALSSDFLPEVLQRTASGGTFACLCGYIGKWRFLCRVAKGSLLLWAAARGR